MIEKHDPISDKYIHDTNTKTQSSTQHTIRLVYDREKQKLVTLPSIVIEEVL